MEECKPFNAIIALCFFNEQSFLRLKYIEIVMKHK
jgi:hypothetical protein